MFKSILFLSFLLCISYVQADTPVNCMYEDVIGTWRFALSNHLNTNKVNCSAFDPTSPFMTIDITLSYPNVATNFKGQTGTWTLIYNQGIEIRINHWVYFAFLYYEQNGSNVTSYCDRTFNGWYHMMSTSSDSHDWGCYRGHKVNTLSPITHVSDIYDPIRLNTKYRTNKQLIKKINTVQSLWKAKVYPEYEQMTIGEIEKQSGSYTSLKNILKENEMLSLIKDQSTMKPKLKAQDVPKVFDWRNLNGVNYVSPVRSQGSCGSCYSFASMGMMEARVRVFSNNTQTPIFSTQEVVSCSQYSQGCGGGFPYLIAGKYAHDYGLVEEECYPYEGKDGVCQPLKCPNGKRWYTGEYNYIGGYYGASTVQLMQEEILFNGPIAVSFEVEDDFRYYQGGVYKHTGIKHGLGYNPFVLTNHVVVIVGWGETDDNVPYWIVKNSWGPNWGENGYFRIVRGSPQYGGECGIESLTVSAMPILH